MVWLWNGEISNKSSPTDPECSCSNCCTGSIIPTLLFWNLFTGLKFLNELNTRLSLSQNSQHHSATVSQWSHIYSASSRSQDTLNLTSLWSNHLHHSKSFIAPLEVLHLIFGTSYITQNTSSKLFIPSQRPSFQHASLTCYTLLSSPSITFHCFALSSKLTFLENLSSTLVCFCLLDWCRGIPFTSFICSLVFMF